MKRVIRNICIALAGVVVLLLVLVQFLLTPSVLGRIADRILPSLTDGNATYSSIRASVIRSFPNLNISVEDFALTYPHERFAAFDSLRQEQAKPGRFSMIHAGEGAGEDTLASFRRLSLSLNYVGILRGNYSVPSASLTKPRIFLHRFDTTASNWDILTFLSDSDTSSSPLPPVTVHRLRLDEKPLVIFTDPVDTLYGLLTMKQVRFDGRLQTVEAERSVIGLGIDTLFVSGRLPSDTLALALESVKLEARDRRGSFDARAKAFLATEGYGRMAVPIRAEGTVALPEREDGGLGIDVERLNLDIASLVADMNGNAILYPDSLLLSASATVQDCPLGNLMETYSSNFPFLKKIHTDALLSLDATIDGCYRPAADLYPEVRAKIRIPESALQYEGFARKGRVSLALAVATDPALKTDLTLNNLLADIPGLQLKAKGSADDLLGKDPAVAMDAQLKARVDSLTGLLPRDMGLSGTGAVDATLTGKGRFSHMDMSKIAESELDGKVLMDNLFLRDAKDTLTAAVPHAALTLKTMGNQLDKSLKQGERVIGLTAEVDSLDVTYKKDMYIRGKELKLLTHTAATVLSGKSGNYPPFLGLLTGKAIALRDGDDLSVFGTDTRNRFRITPSSGGTPTLSLQSSFSRLGMRQEDQRIAASGATLDLTARKSPTLDRAARSAWRERYLDTLQVRYPGVPRDSLMHRARTDRTLPDWMSEADFRRSDIHFSLSESVMKYFREWNVDGNLAVKDGRIATPLWPLQNKISGLKGTFTNDRIDIREVKIESGGSDISGSATLSGLRGALSRRGLFRLKADLSSDVLDLDELLLASAGESEEETTAADTSSTGLLVLPGNVDATVRLNTKAIRYDSLRISRAHSVLTLKERCLRLTDTEARSNIGSLRFEGFYSTRTKKDLKAGFDLTLAGITAEKVIEMLPAVDTILPLLKTFKGKIDCRMTATSLLDEQMSLVLPSLDGVMLITGKNLAVDGNRQFSQLAKLLKFDNTREAVVDSMSVSGIIRDSKLEVFPFVVRVDRYTLAMSGLQHFDESFKYHVSVIRSPLPLKFGIDISGENFDKMRFKVRGAKYRNIHVPAFTQELDEVRFNLVQSIRNIYEVGVDKAIRNNTGQAIVFDRMRREHFSNETDSSELPEEEKKELAKALKEKTETDEQPGVH